MYYFDLFQQIKRQFGMASRVTAAGVGSSVQSAAIASLDLARNIRDKLPVQKREDFLELEAWLTDGDDETLTANRAQLKDYIARGTFGTVEREYVHNALLRLFTKRFANSNMSWAGAKGNKEFTLKTSAVWELLNDVISTKHPNFQKNMAVLFNNFHKDVGKEVATGRGRRCAGGSGRGDRGRRDSGNEDEPAVNTTPDDLLEGGVEEVDEQQIPDCEVRSGSEEM